MRVAVVGAGLAGVAVCHYLRQRGADVVLFDHKGIGQGASGMPSGMFHAYPGKQGVRSKHADEAMKLTSDLITLAEVHADQVVALKNGVFRIDWTPKEDHSDLVKVDGGVLITSGMTVYFGAYIFGLFTSMQGLVFEKRAFKKEDEGDFDAVVWATGAGVMQFEGVLPVQLVKGQALIMKHPSQVWERSVIGIGHLSPLPDGLVQIGSTYEHHFADLNPDPDVAMKYLKPRVETFLPPLSEFELIRVVAGGRVAQKGSYLPITKQLDAKNWVYTGLGSRGLLYHAYCGRHLANLILS